MGARQKMKRDLVGDTTAREPGPLVATGIAAKSALLSRATLVAIAFSVVAAILWQFAGVFWLVPAVFAVLFGCKLVQLAPWNEARRRRELPLLLPEPVAFSDGAAQSIVTRLSQARRGLQLAIAESPRGPGFDLGSALRGVRDLERRALVLLARVEYVSRFLATTSPSQLEAELARLESGVRKARTPDARNIYEEAAARCGAHIEAIHALETEREQLLGKLDYTVGTLEALPAKVTRIQLARICAAEGSTSGIEPWDQPSEATSVFDDLQAVEDAFTVSVPPPPPVS
jgi:hypothetical protein